MKSNQFDFLSIVLDELSKLDNGRIISFRVVTQRLGVMFHFSRKQTFEVLRTMEKRGFVKMHNYHGVRVIKKT